MTNEVLLLLIELTSKGRYQRAKAVCKVETIKRIRGFNVLSITPREWKLILELELIDNLKLEETTEAVTPKPKTTRKSKKQSDNIETVEGED